MSYSDETIAYAIQRGIDPVDLPLVSNGCTGLSLFYTLGGESISCEQCCHRHDIDYELGGSNADRKDSDTRLRECAGRAPGLPVWESRAVEANTWRGALKGAALGLWDAGAFFLACLWWPVRRFWRWLRAWIMYGAVRMFGGRHWAGE